MIYKPFSACLIRGLAADDYDLPLSHGDMARLAIILPPNESMYLTLRDGYKYEEILIANTCGNIQITARGVGNTTANKFPAGTAVCFDVTIEIVKDLICHHDCCADPECPCEAISITGALLPDGLVGQAWEGSVIFSGDQPMVLTTSSMPGWMSTQIGPNFIKLYGVPTNAGPISIAVAGTNCAGVNVITSAPSFVVTQPD
jgi:hypothetical protein